MLAAVSRLASCFLTLVMMVGWQGLFYKAQLQLSHRLLGSCSKQETLCPCSELRLEFARHQLLLPVDTRLQSAHAWRISTKPKNFLLSSSSGTWPQRSAISVLALLTGGLQGGNANRSKIAHGNYCLSTICSCIRVKIVRTRPVEAYISHP